MFFFWKPYKRTVGHSQLQSFLPPKRTHICTVITYCVILFHLPNSKTIMLDCLIPTWFSDTEQHIFLLAIKPVYLIYIYWLKKFIIFDEVGEIFKYRTFRVLATIQNYYTKFCHMKVLESMFYSLKIIMLEWKLKNQCLNYNVYILSNILKITLSCLFIIQCFQ